MKRALIVIGILLGLFACVIVLVAGYFGFVPGVSTVMGATKTKDLGVQWTEADLESFRQKVKTELVEIPADEETDDPATSIRYSGSREVTTEFTSEEVTALLNNYPWKYWPLENVQIRFNGDGTVEMSGNLNTGVFIPYTNATGGTTAEIMNAIKLSRFLRGPAFYVLADASAEADVLSLNVQQAQIGQFTATADQISQHQDKVRQYMQERFDWLPGFSIASARIEDGKLLFDGTLAETEAAVRE